jgi:type IV pilus assembly protein PilV
MKTEPRAHRSLRTGRSARGISLIEVLVVLVLFSFGLIGMVGLQARAVQTSVGAEDSARAALLASDLAARMWGERSLNLDSAAIDDWNDRVADPTQGGLPNGAGTVTVASGVATITVTWKPPHEPAAAASNVYRTQVQMP